MTQRQQTVGATSVATLGYGYDLADRITAITYPSGREVRYDRDAKGRVAGVATRGAAAASWVSVASAIGYQPFGAVEGMSLGNGLSVANDRGLDGRLRSRRLASSTTGAALSDLRYRHDPDGNVAGIDDAVNPERSALYGYDAMGRLNLTVAQGSAASASYSYTSGTNRLTGINGPAGARSISYDTRGNPVSEVRPGSQSVDIAYDGHGRMTSYARSGEASLTHLYNGLDDRVATTSVTAGGSETRRFVYAPDGRVIGEYGSSANDVKAEFIWMSPEVGESGTFGGDDGLGGYMPLAVAANDNNGASQLLWVHANHMGVPAVMTDAQGTALPFPTSYALPGFPGQSRTFADLYYNRYRDYDPTTGRYIQADPIGLAGGSSPYSYAMNNPLRYVDPSGLGPEIAGCVLAGPAAPACAAVDLVGTGLAALYAYYMLSHPADAPKAPAVAEPDCPPNGSCPPCRTISGRIVPVGTVGYRPLDTPSRPQHGIIGPHHNLLIANQAPRNSPKPCKCFWQPAGAVSPGNLPRGAIPVERFAN
jgi:RHS repeat-associated protein